MSTKVILLLWLTVMPGQRPQLTATPQATMQTCWVAARKLMNEYKGKDDLLVQAGTKYGAGCVVSAP